jgi:hypothetical protein
MDMHHVVLKLFTTKGDGKALVRVRMTYVHVELYKLSQVHLWNLSFRDADITGVITAMTR